ncbi:MAG TPA: ankyrin repeat domain-containing protein [Gammaproteobacteria bacterium]|nr:ankyrin repeat domain-containing protein [Gammaproteobacteria bacterium]
MNELSPAEKHKMAKLEEEFKSSPTHRDELGCTLLHWACYLGDCATVVRLLESSADIEAEAKVDKRRPLHEAANNGKTTVVDILLTHGAELHAEDAYGWTALHFAAWKCHIDTAIDLLAKGAVSHAKDKEGLSPYERISKRNANRVAMKLLLKVTQDSPRNVAAEVEPPEPFPSSALLKILNPK